VPENSYEQFYSIGTVKVFTTFSVWRTTFKLCTKSSFEKNNWL